MRALLAITLVGCSGATSLVGPVRFENAAPVWTVDDRRDVPKPPREREYKKYGYHFESYYRHTIRALSVERPRRALGINSVDEVPDTTWFTNRIGIRDMSADEIRRGPQPESPEAHFPWTIKRSKAGGTDIGFVAEDSRGEKFLLKFDRKNTPETETAADAIVARLLWAAGYNAPADHVVYFRRGDLRVAPDSYTKVDGKKRPIDAAFLDEKLAQIGSEPDGRIRGIASMYIKGTLLGGTPRAGVRADDPNDRIPHELRRDQRGLAVFLAWLSHTDMKEDNSLDAWQEDPANKSVHYVVHYLVDFGWALGTDAEISNQPYVDYRYGVDPEATLVSILTLGLLREPWEYREPSRLRGVGLYSDRDYDPAKWKLAMPSQYPVIWADRIDKLWGSKILMRFTREQLAAAVESARFSDPRSARYMLDTLIARQRRTARHWFRQAAPLDEVTVDGRLCFTDLALKYRLETTATRFEVAVLDAGGRQVAPTMVATAATNGRACTASLPLASGRDRYTIFRIESSRGVPGMLVHVAQDPETKPRVIGLHRL